MFVFASIIFGYIFHVVGKVWSKCHATMINCHIGWPNCSLIGLHMNVTTCIVTVDCITCWMYGQGLAVINYNFFLRPIKMNCWNDLLWHSTFPSWFPSLQNVMTNFNFWHIFISYSWILVVNICSCVLFSNQLLYWQEREFTSWTLYLVIHMSLGTYSHLE